MSTPLPEHRPRHQPPASLDGLSVALLDVGKQIGAEFMERFAAYLSVRGIPSARFAKEIPTHLASGAVLDRVAGAHRVAVLALGDCGSSVSSAAHDLLHLDNRGVAGVAVILSHYADVFRVQCDVMRFGGASIELSAVDPDPFSEALFARTLAAITAQPPERPPASATE